MGLTTMTVTVKHHDATEMHRMIVCLASILSGLYPRDPDARTAGEQTSIRVPPAPETTALMALWRRTLVAKQFNMTLPEVEAYRSTLNHGNAGGRAAEETPALRTRGGPIFAVVTNGVGARVLRRRTGKLARGTSPSARP